MDQYRAANLHAQLDGIASGAPHKLYNEIEPGFYLGEDPEMQTFRMIHPMADAMCSLNESPPTLTYPNLKARLWMPIHDRPPFPGLAWLESVVDWLEDALIFQHWTVYLYCRAGISRSGMVATAYLMRRDGLDVERAALTIAMKRAIVPNHSFLEGLIEWEEYLK